MYRKERIEQIANSFVEQLQLIHTDNVVDEDEDEDDVFLQGCIRNFVDGTTILPSSLDNQKQQQEVVYMDDLEHEDLLKAFYLAGEKWKTLSLSSKQTGKEGTTTTTTTTTSNSSNPTTSSFSLFDQLQQGGGGLLFGGGGGGFEMPVTIDEIKEVDSQKEKLVLLQKISYIDDILHDWSEFQSLLKSSLLLIQEEEATTIISNNNNNNNNNNTDEVTTTKTKTTETTIAMEYLILHRKFYNLCRASSSSSSPEYDYIAYNLCQNLLEVAIQAVVINNNPSSSSYSSILKKTQQQQFEFIVTLIKNWRDMFLDLMIRNRYIEIEAREMQFLPFMIRNIVSRCHSPNNTTTTTTTITTTDDNNDTNDHSNNNSSSSSLQQLLLHPFHILSSIDTLATWFEAWVGHVTPRHLAYLLETNVGIIPDLLERAFQQRQQQQQSSNVNVNVNQTSSSVGGGDDDENPEKNEDVANNLLLPHNNNKIIYASQIQAVAMLSHILCKTRVSLFPWKQCIIISIKNDDEEEGGNKSSTTTTTVDPLTLQELQQKLSQNDDNNNDDEDNFKIGNTNFYSSEGNDNDDAASAANNAAIAIKSLLNLFVDALSWDYYYDDDDKVDNWKLMCFNAIDTLLWGCISNLHHNDDEKNNNVTTNDFVVMINDILPVLNERILLESNLKVSFQIRLQEVMSVLLLKN